MLDGPGWVGLGGKRMNRGIAIAVALVVILSGVYFGSPYYAVHSLRSAALEADTDKLEEGLYARTHPLTVIARRQ